MVRRPNSHLRDHDFCYAFVTCAVESECAIGGLFLVVRMFRVRTGQILIQFDVGKPLWKLSGIWNFGSYLSCLTWTQISSFLKKNWNKLVLCMSWGRRGGYVTRAAFFLLNILLSFFFHFYLTVHFCIKWKKPTNALYLLIQLLFCFSPTCFGVARHHPQGVVYN
jgi:hypothetical protein